MPGFTAGNRALWHCHSLDRNEYGSTLEPADTWHYAAGAWHLAEEPIKKPGQAYCPEVRNAGRPDRVVPSPLVVHSGLRVLDNKKSPTETEDDCTELAAQPPFSVAERACGFASYLFR